MKNKQNLMTILVSSLIFCSICFLGAGVSHAEESGAAFLKIGVGARPIGMGSAFVAVADDATAVFWNPAGLSQLKTQQINAMHTEWISDINYDYIGYVNPIGKNAIGISVVYLSTGNIEKRGTSGEDLGDFTAYDACATISYARQLSSIVGLGINLKVIQQKIENETANGIAIDIGQMYKLPVTGLSLGIAVQNIGPKMKFIEEEYSLPLTVSIGTAYRILGLLNLGLDVKHQVIDDRTSISFGMEYLPVSVLTLRAGYLMGLLKLEKETGQVAGVYTDFKELTGVGAGLGFNLGITAVDYAFVPYGDLGNTHRISLLVKF